MIEVLDVRDVGNSGMVVLDCAELRSKFDDRHRGAIHSLGTVCESVATGTSHIRCVVRGRCCHRT